MKLTEEMVEAMCHRLLESHELHPLTHANIRALRDAALRGLAGEDRVSVPMTPTKEMIYVGDRMDKAGTRTREEFDASRGSEK